MSLFRIVFYGLNVAFLIVVLCNVFLLLYSLNSLSCGIKFGFLLFLIFFIFYFLQLKLM